MLFGNEKVDRDVFVSKIRSWSIQEGVTVENNPDKLYESYLASDTISVFDFLYDLCADDILVLS